MGAALDNAHYIAEGGAPAALPRICAWSVCRAWRDCLTGPPPYHLARLLLEVHGPDQALMRAMRCASATVDRSDLIMEVLGLPQVRADCLDGSALIAAAEAGDVDVARLLLERGEHAAKADCQNGLALIYAARHGHEDLV